MAEKIIYDVQFRGVDKITTDLAAVNRESKRLKDANKELSKSYDENSKEIAENELKLRNLSKEKADLVKESKNEKKANEALSGSNDELSAKLSDLKKKYNALSKEQRENTSEGLQMKNTINSLNDELGKNEAAIGSYGRNVGNYANAFKEASEAGNIHVKVLGTVGQSLSGIMSITGKNIQLTKVQTKENLAAAAGQGALAKATVVTNGVLKLFKLALISTGIGAIVVALGTLVAAFLSTQKGVDTLNRALAPLKGAFEGFIGMIQLASQDIIPGFVKILKRDFKGGIEQIKKGTKAFDEFGKKIEESAEKGKEIQALTVQIEKMNIALTQDEKKIEQQINQQRTLLSTTGLVAAERINAGKEVIRLEDELLARKTAVAQKEFDLAKLKAGLSDTDREDQQEIANLENARDAAIADSINRKKEAVTQLAAVEKQLLDKSEADRKARDAKAEADKKAEFDRLNKEYEEREKLEDKLTEQRLKDNEDALRQQLIAVKENQAAGLISQEQANAEALRLNKEFLTQQMVDVEAILNDPDSIGLDDVILSDEQQANLNEKFTALREQLAQVNIDLGNVNKDPETEETFADVWETLSPTEKGMEAVALIGSQFNQITSVIGQNFMAQRTRLQDELKKGAISKEQFDKDMAKLDKKEGRRKKATALIQGALNIAQSILSAIAQFGPPPSPLGIAGIAAASTIGAVQLATIAAQKFERGGLLNGPSHAQGGIPFTVRGKSGFEAEGGEAIINAQSTALFKDQLSAINSYNGFGVAFAAGGITPPSSIDVNDPAQSTIMEVVMVESEVSGSQNSVRAKQVEARI